MRSDSGSDLCKASAKAAVFLAILVAEEPQVEFEVFFCFCFFFATTVFSLSLKYLVYFGRKRP